MSNLKVAYILFRFPCLTETFIAEEIQKIRASGVEVQVYSLLTSEEKLVHPVSLSILPFTQSVPGFLSPGIWSAQVKYLWKNFGLYFHLLWTLLKQPTRVNSTYFERLAIFLKGVWVASALESYKFNVIHTHFAWLSAAGAWVASQLLGIPFTVTTHAFDIYSERNDLLPLITSQAAKIVTISEHNKIAILEANPNLSVGNIKVIRCGVDLSFFSNPFSSEKLIEFPLQITSVGSLIEKKGHDFLIRACAELNNQEIPFHCVIVGSGSQEMYLRSLIEKYNLTGKVVLAGKQSQEWIKERLRQSHLFVLACIKTSDDDQDGIPVSLMEAMAMRVPVISTAVSGIPELIENEKNGLLIEDRDPGAIAQGIKSISQDPELRQTFRENGLRKIDQDYNIHKNVDQLKKIFSMVAAENKLTK